MRVAFRRRNKLRDISEARPRHESYQSFTRQCERAPSDTGCLIARSTSSFALPFCQLLARDVDFYLKSCNFSCCCLHEYIPHHVPNRASSSGFLSEKPEKHLGSPEGFQSSCCSCQDVFNIVTSFQSTSGLVPITIGGGESGKF